MKKATVKSIYKRSKTQITFVKTVQIMRTNSYSLKILIQS
jgi:hypothetical protein